MTIKEDGSVTRLINDCNRRQQCHEVEHTKEGSKCHEVDE